MNDWIYAVVAGSDDEVTNTSPGGRRLWIACGDLAALLLLQISWRTRNDPT